MSNINEHLEQFGWKHSLKVSTISLNTKQEPQSTKRVGLTIANSGKLSNRPDANSSHTYDIHAHALKTIYSLLC